MIHLWFAIACWAVLAVCLLVMFYLNYRLQKVIKLLLATIQDMSGTIEELMRMPLPK